MLDTISSRGLSIQLLGTEIINQTERAGKSQDHAVRPEDHAIRPEDHAVRHEAQN